MNNLGIEMGIKIEHWANMLRTLTKVEFHLFLVTDSIDLFPFWLLLTSSRHSRA